MSNNSPVWPYVRPFVRNAWYCAAWADEVGEELVSRRLLNVPVVMYRAETGEAVALMDICPHKFAPIHLGQRSGDNLICGYHGLEFDKTGRCVHNPQGNGMIPNGTKLRSYPLVERHGVLWIWMGDPARANPDTIADFSHLTSPQRRTVKSHRRIAGNYMLLVENLMDLGHGQFLHRQSGGAALIAAPAEHKVIQEGEIVHDRRLYSATKAPPVLGAYLDDPSMDVDLWTDIRCNVPSLVRNHTGVSPVGVARTEAPGVVDQLGSHLLTPETQNSTHYFCGNSRNFALDDPQADAHWAEWQRRALVDEDGMMVEAISPLLKDIESLDIDMVRLNTDGSGVRVNRLIDKMVAEELTLAA